MLFTFSCGPELHPHLTALPKGSALVLRKTLKKTNKTKSNTKKPNTHRAWELFKASNSLGLAEPAFS